MRTLTNDYHDFELVNLKFSESGRGPYSIRQDGVPSGADIQQEDRYLLRKDGVWVLNFRVFLLSEEDQQQFLYDSIGEVQGIIQNLSGKPTVEAGLPDGKSREELLQAADTTRDRIFRHIQEAHGSKVPMD